MTGRDPFGSYRERLAALGFRPRRKLGQNFLLDPSLHRAVAAAAELDERDLVLEVGAGLGFLTRELAPRCGALVAVEIDPRLARILGEELAGMPAGERVEIVVGDVLGDGDTLAPAVGAALAARRPDHRRLCAVANLPYAICGPLIAALLQVPSGPPEVSVFLVQREFAARLAAPPGTRAYGGLSAVVQVACEVEVLRRVGREVFRPRPRVDSALVRLRLRPDSAFGALDAAGRAGFGRFVRAMFGTRRKTLRHALDRAGWGGRVADPDLVSRRPEELSAERLYALWRTVADGAPESP